ncbi:MAG: hypothetical protein AB1705_09525 [Verrucomicrobiota bacterium]
MKLLPVAVLALALAGCGEKSAPDSAPASGSSSGSPVTAPVDYLGAQAKAKKSAEKDVILASVNQAIQAFQVAEGRNPKDLDELVKGKYLKALPEAPYNTKIEYDAQRGEIKIVPK